MILRLLHNFLRGTQLGGDETLLNTSRAIVPYYNFRRQRSKQIGPVLPASWVVSSISDEQYYLREGNAHSQKGPTR